MSGHFDLAALDMLVAVVESGGFTAAGARLGRTQSAISVRIQDLENQLGHRLLERSRRGVVPTPAGERSPVDRQAASPSATYNWSRISRAGAV